MRKTFFPLLALLAAAALGQDGRLDLARGAEAQVGVTLVYDPSYVRLRYPGGDVPTERGVCADVVVRAFRRIGIDLQARLHEDMASHFALQGIKSTFPEL